MIKMETRDWQTLQQILSKYPYSFYAYGSRVKGNARKFSDLDLCYQKDIPWNDLIQLQEDLEESDLPFIVELVSWKRMKPEFQESIKRDLTLIN